MSLASTGLVDLAFDRGIEQAQPLGHDQQDRNAIVAEGPDEDRGLATDRIDDAGTDDQRPDESEHLFVEMRQREHGQQPIARPERQDLGHRRGAGHQVAMGEHRPLGFTRGPAREDDLGERVGDHRGRRARPSTPSEVRQRLKPDDRKAEFAGGGFGLARGDHDLGARLADDLATELDGVADVERDGHAADVGEAQEGQSPFRAVDCPDDRPVTRLDAGVGEHARRRGGPSRRDRDTARHGSGRTAG